VLDTIGNIFNDFFCDARFIFLEDISGQTKICEKIPLFELAFQWFPCVENGFADVVE